MSINKGFYQEESEIYLSQCILDHWSWVNQPSQILGLDIIC